LTGVKKLLPVSFFKLIFLKRNFLSRAKE